jgi:hypothetical protein
LVYAIQGANSVLDDGESRRRWGVAVFSELTWAVELKRLTRPQTAEVHHWCVGGLAEVSPAWKPLVVQVHRAMAYLSADPDLESPEVRANLLDMLLPLWQNLRWSSDRDLPAAAIKNSCKCSLHYACYGLPAIATNGIDRHAGHSVRAVRDAGRAVACGQDVQQTIAFCLGLARKLGVAVAS